jgi:hypothetical protein
VLPEGVGENLQISEWFCCAENVRRGILPVILNVPEQIVLLLAH